jgi:hypothetical protein
LKNYYLKCFARYCVLQSLLGIALIDAGCKPYFTQVNIAGIRVVDSSNEKNEGYPLSTLPPNVKMLKVEISTDININPSALSSGIKPIAKAYICRLGDNGVLKVWPYLYFHGRRAPLQRPEYDKLLKVYSGPPHSYYFYIFTEHSKAKSLQQEAFIVYNLVTDPEDVCFFMTGTGMFPFSDVFSKTLTIKKSVIIEAYKEFIITKWAHMSGKAVGPGC